MQEKPTIEITQMNETHSETRVEQDKGDFLYWHKVKHIVKT